MNPLSLSLLVLSIIAVPPKVNIPGVHVGDGAPMKLDVRRFDGVKVDVPPGHIEEENPLLMDQKELAAYLRKIKDIKLRVKVYAEIKKAKKKLRLEEYREIQRADASRDRYNRKARIRAGIPAAKHTASRLHGARMAERYWQGYKWGLRRRGIYVP